MNYIARFFFNLLDNEEEAFYLMLGTFQTCGFASIYINELAKLKQYFYVLERLIKLYLPELYNHLRVNTHFHNCFRVSKQKQATTLLHGS